MAGTEEEIEGRRQRFRKKFEELGESAIRADFDNGRISKNGSISKFDVALEWLKEKEEGRAAAAAAEKEVAATNAKRTEEKEDTHRKESTQRAAKGNKLAADANEIATEANTIAAEAKGEATRANALAERAMKYSFWGVVIAVVAAIVAIFK